MAIEAAENMKMLVTWREGSAAQPKNARMVVALTLRVRKERITYLDGGCDDNRSMVDQGVVLILSSMTVKAKSSRWS